MAALRLTLNSYWATYLPSTSSKRLLELFYEYFFLKQKQKGIFPFYSLQNMESYYFFFKLNYEKENLRIYELLIKNGSLKNIKDGIHCNKSFHGILWVLS